jgi:hypothetical protein
MINIRKGAGMRFNEFTNEDEQLSLLRLIVDNTWAALEQHAMEQRRVVEKSKPRKAKPKRVRARKLKPLPVSRNVSRTPQRKPQLAKPKQVKQMPLPLQHKSAIKPIKAFSLQQPVTPISSPPHSSP